MFQSPHLQPPPLAQPLPPPTRHLLLSPWWPRKNHGTTHCMSRPWARPLTLVLAVNLSGWILTVLLPPLPGNEAGLHPGRIKARSPVNVDHMQRPLLWQTPLLFRTTVPVCLRKVTLMVIKGVYHEHFAVSYLTDFEHF